MIAKMRRAAGTWISKVLLILISCTFLFWKIGGSDIAGSNMAASIAGRKISVPELEIEFRRQVAQMQSLMGGVQLDYRQAVKMGLFSQALDNMIYRLLLDMETADKGIVLSDEKIYAVIQGMGEFRDDKGNFSAEKFAYILEQNGIPERQFVSEVANEITRGMLAGIVAGGISPGLLADALYRRSREIRNVDLVVFRAADERPATPPSDMELEELYGRNVAMFREPEYRRISYIGITPAAAAKYGKIPLSDSDGVYKAMYELGENVVDEISGGGDIAAALKSFGLEKTLVPDLSMDGRTRDGQEFRDPVFTQKYRDVAFFALDEGGVSDVMDAPRDGAMLVLVEKVYPARPKPLEAVKGALTDVWKLEKGRERAAARAAKVLSAMKEGRPMSTAAAEAGASASARLNARMGRGDSGYPAEFLSGAFSADLDVPFEVVAGDSYYVAAVRSISLPEVSDKAGLAKFGEEEKRALGSAVMGDYLGYLYRKYDVEKNEKVLRAVMNVN